MKRLTEHLYYFQEEDGALYVDGAKFSFLIDGADPAEIIRQLEYAGLKKPRFSVVTSALPITGEIDRWTNEKIAESCSATLIFQHRMTIRATDVTAKIFELEHIPQHLIIYFSEDRVLYLGSVLQMKEENNPEKIKMLLYIVESLQCEYVIVRGWNPFEKEKILDYLYQRLQKC